MAIDLSKIIDITASTIGAGFTGATQAGVFLDKNPIIPFNGTQQQVILFTSAVLVGQYFGTNSEEYAAAVNYFNSYDGTLDIPPFCYFARYVDIGSAPNIQSGQLNAVNNLAALQAIDAGTITFTFNGIPSVLTALDFSGITTFAEAAAIVEAELTDSIPDATVIYSTEYNAFIASNNDASGSDTVAYCATTATSVAMNLTAATGAILTQGSGGAISPYTRGATLFLSDLTALRAITSGTFSVVFNGITTTLSGVNLSSYTSFSAIAAHLQSLLSSPIPAATVTYSSVTQAFTVSNNDASGTSTVGYCPVTTVGTAMKITQATGAILSQGSPALTVAENLNNVVAITRNWTSFTNLFSLPNAPDYDYQFDFCNWVIANPEYIYMLWTTEPNLTIPGNQSNIAYAMVSQGLATLNADGSITYLAQMMPNFGEVDLAAFCMGMGAGINYNNTAATINFAGKTQAGILPLVTTNLEYDALIANSFNFYGQFASKANTYNFTENGTIGGPLKFVNNVYDEIWLTDAIQNQLAVLVQTLKRIPYNNTGYSTITSSVNSIMNQAINNGVAETGNTFDSIQTAALIQQAGYDITPELTNSGYVIQIVPATPAERTARDPIHGNVWYTNGGAINQITFSVVFVQ